MGIGARRRRNVEGSASDASDADRIREWPPPENATNISASAPVESSMIANLSSTSATAAKSR